MTANIEQIKKMIGQTEEHSVPTCRTCIFYENNCPKIRGKFVPYPLRICKDYAYSEQLDSEKQKEQEPAEWSEEDEAKLKRLCRIIHIHRLHGLLSLKEESELGKWIDKWINHEPQHEKKWRKEDAVFLNEIIDFFENKTVKLQHDIDMYAHWLKLLPERFNLQPKEGAKKRR